MTATPYRIIMCDGTSCINKGSRKLTALLREQLDKHGLADRTTIGLSGCLGMCDKGPIMVVNPGYTIYGHVTEADIPEIVEEHLVNGRPIARLVIQEDHLYNRFFRVFGDAKFFGKQMRVTLRNCGIIDPENIDDYLSLRGYEALAKAITEMTPDQVVAEVEKSGLRGRGGAGFPTGRKWRLTANEKATPKYVICNADEGDPGAFMDRSAIEGDPHTIVEGMAIGGYAVGADRGVVYIRAEYPLAIKRIQKAIEDARANGLLGKNILGSNFSFDIEIRLGAGAFVCGEETALIHSIEGKRGMPRPRPPYPAASRSLGQAHDRSTTSRPGRTSPSSSSTAPTGSRDRHREEQGHQGLRAGRQGEQHGPDRGADGHHAPRDHLRHRRRHRRAASSSRPSRPAVLPAAAFRSEYLDTPIDYESLAKAGSIMGSGGMIVMDEDTCMVDVARFFLEFTQDESCGKCTPCREGTKRMLEILVRITEGKGKPGDIENLERLGNMIKKSALCGLGQSAPNPVLSTIKNFREEYEEHIHEKKCRAKACKYLVSYEIGDKCIGCGACRRVCPVGTIAGSPKSKHAIDQNKCVHCGLCFNTCKFEAIAKV